MTTDQAVETTQAEADPNALVIDFPSIGVPDVVMIDGLRQQVSVLNDEVVRLRIDLDFKNGLVRELQRMLTNAPFGEHTHEGVAHVHEEFDA